MLTAITGNAYAQRSIFDNYSNAYDQARAQEIQRAQMLMQAQQQARQSAANANSYFNGFTHQFVVDSQNTGIVCGYTNGQGAQYLFVYTNINSCPNNR